MTPDNETDDFGRWNAEVRGASPAEDYRNGPNTYGWVVEVDPFRGCGEPRKRTALGRLAHEGAGLGPVEAGKPLAWYMGDDSRGEYVYKFVSARSWDPANVNGGYEAGDKYLDEGRLYVARFDVEGTGEWIELGHGVNGLDSSSTNYPFADQADVVINARLAADAVAATPLDRPEWTATNPLTGEST